MNNITGKEIPILFIAAPGAHPGIKDNCHEFLCQHWPTNAVIVWPFNPTVSLAATVVLCGAEDLENSQFAALHRIIAAHVPVLVINISDQSSRFWTDLASRNNRVIQLVSNGKSWHDACFHFLGSLKDSLAANNFSLLAISLSERQEKQAAQLASA